MAPEHIPRLRPHPFAPMELTFAKVNTRITDQVAVTTVDQEFANPNATRLEGTFIFPLPKGAQIDKFSMEIDGKRVEAELLKAEKARGIYEEIVRKLRDPALLEYAGRDVYKVRIFPIEPYSKKRVSITYTELLKADNGLLNYKLPLSTGKYSCRPIKNVSLKLKLESKRPLKTIYSPSHKVEIKREGTFQATISWEQSEVATTEDFSLYFAPEPDEIGVNLLTCRTADEEGYFLLLASPGVDRSERKVIPKDILFVLDTSGSMAGKKLEQAQKALQFCIANLNATDRFEILRFSTEVEPVFESIGGS
jgi:Ca-activated chloride channel family protein